MQQTGTVLKANGKTAVVLLEKNSSCASCNACGSKPQSFKTRALNTVNAASGDKVSIKPGKAGESASVIAYLLPVVFSGAGLFIGRILGKELMMFLCFVLMLLLSFVIISIIDKSLSKKPGYSPEIVEVLEKNESLRNNV